MSEDPLFPLVQQALRAKVFAQFAHVGQKDKAGDAYFSSHIESAVRMFRQRTWSEGLSPVGTYDHYVTLAVIYLHDVVEDTRKWPQPVTEETLLGFGFLPDIVTGVSLMTRRRDVPKEEYYEAISGNHFATYAKAADMDSNTLPSRLHRLPREKQVHFLKKYIDGFERIRLRPLHHLPEMLHAAEQTR